MIDASASVLHYDVLLLEALSKVVDVELLTSIQKGMEGAQKDNVYTKYFFLRLSSHFPPKIYHARYFYPLKGAEYFIDLFRLRAYLEKEKCDIIHYQWFPAPIIDCSMVRSFKEKFSIPIVYTAHNVLPHESRVFDHSLYGNIYHAVDKIIVHSNGIKKELCDIFKVDDRKVEVIPIPVYKKNVKIKLNQNEARKNLNLGANEKIVLFFGNILRYKGLDTLLKAIAKTTSVYEDIRLVIAGRCDDFSPYEKMINDLGIGRKVVRIIKYIPDNMLEILFSAADVFVLPYKKIYGSGALMLGVAFGMPMIVTNTGFMPEMIFDGKEGFIVSPSDDKELSQAIIKFFKLSQKDRDAMSNRVRLMSDAYSPENISLQTKQLYEKVIEERYETRSKN